ncbi:transcription initiation factor IIE subunit alpha (T2EA) [Vairimorpha necatrix]|uniref:Transcription initiation factor IIE subunit alpha (T2EA) n=1 Tax=Vairimorpha necatrix TaxID=6039 RepID=A0AAX4JB06_9MICR
MEYLPHMKSLIQTVVRKFYELHHCILVDIILENILIYDTDLQKLMKMHNKEINKLLVALKEDKIIKYENKVEVFEDKRQYLRTVYYINFVEVRDIIKYKIFKITKKLDEDLRNSTKEGYYCKTCDKQFSALDAQLIMTNYIFQCDECNGELIENGTNCTTENTLNAKFMNNIRDIINLLKELDKFEIPNMDFFQLTEFKKELEKKTEEKKDIVEIKTEENFMSIESDIIKYEEDEKKEEIKNDIEDFVSVNGEMKKFKDVTDEDIEKMNEEEYEKYFEVYSKNN